MTKVCAFFIFLLYYFPKIELTDASCSPNGDCDLSSCPAFVNILSHNMGSDAFIHQSSHFQSYANNHQESMFVGGRDDSLAIWHCYGTSWTWVMGRKKNKGMCKGGIHSTEDTRCPTEVKVWKFYNGKSWLEIVDPRILKVEELANSTCIVEGSKCILPLHYEGDNGHWLNMTACRNDGSNHESYCISEIPWKFHIQEGVCNEQCMDKDGPIEFNNLPKSDICQAEPDVRNTQCKTEEKSCKFPFIFQNKIYTGCTDEHANFLWCATEVYQNKTLKMWGRCSQASCPRDDCLSPNFKCTDGTCISSDKLCDKIEDCQNGEDEVEENCGCLDLPHPVFLLLGETGVGKSTLGNFLLGNNPLIDKTLFPVGFDGDSMESKTAEISWQFGKWMGDPSGKDVTIIDTPGASDTEGRDYDNGIALVKLMKKICSINVFLYVVKGTKTRMTDEQIGQMKLYQSLFSEGMWKHTMMETTFWGHSIKEAKNRKNQRKIDEKIRAKNYNEKLQIEFPNSNLNIGTVFIDPMLEIFKGHDQEAEELADDYGYEYDYKYDRENKNKCDKRQERKHTFYTDQLRKFATSKEPFRCDGRCSNPNGYFTGQPKVSQVSSKYEGEAVEIRCEVWSGYNRNTKNVSIWLNTTVLAVVNGSQVREIDRRFGDKLNISATEDIHGFYTQIYLNIPHFMQNLAGLYQCKNGFEDDENNIANLQMKMDYSLAQWSTWSPCTKTCSSDDDSELGTTSRNRICTPPRNGGRECPSNEKTSDTRLCANKNKGTEITFCPVDAIWDSWLQWSPCQRSCDDGSFGRYRSRRCLEARNFGLETICIGGEMEEQKESCNQSDNNHHICQTGSQRIYTDDVAKQELSDESFTCEQPIIHWPVVDLNDVLKKLMHKCTNTAKLDVSIEADIIYVTQDEEFIGIKTLTTHSNEIIFEKGATRIDFKQVDAAAPIISNANNAIGRDSDGNGNDGIDGNDGEDGINGTLVEFVANSVYAASKSVVFRTYGGKGGKGQNGGNGADGRSYTVKRRNNLPPWGFTWKPKDHNHASFKGTINDALNDNDVVALHWDMGYSRCDDIPLSIQNNRDALKGIHGGKKGGDGGRGGNGGKGGNSGYVQVTSNTNSAVFVELKEVGDGGKAGQGGSGGSGGKGQPPGKTIKLKEEYLSRIYHSYFCYYQIIVGEKGTDGKAGRKGDSGNNGLSGIDDKKSDKQVQFSQAALNTFVRTRAMRSISTKCSDNIRDTVQNCHFLLGLHGYNFPKYFTSSNPIGNMKDEITSKLNDLGSIIEKYNSKRDIANLNRTITDIAKKFVETSLNGVNKKIAILKKRKRNHEEKTPLFKNEMTTIQNKMEDLIYNAHNSKTAALEKKLVKERAKMLINIITSVVTIVGGLASVGLTANTAAEGAKLVKTIAMVNSATHLVQIPSTVNEAKMSAKRLGANIGCDSSIIIEAIDQIEKFKIIETDSNQTKREIVSDYHNYLASSARRKMKESLHCVLTKNSWYQFEDDPHATKLENAIDNYFEASQRMANNMEKIMDLEMDIKLLEVEEKHNTELSKKLKDTKSTALSAELMQKTLFFLEKEILEDIFSWTNGLNYLFLQKFDIWANLNDVFNTPLSVWQNTQDENLNNLKNLNKKVTKWKKECEDEMIKFDWKKDGYVHYRFANKAALDNLKNSTLNRTSISIPVPDKPLNEDITAEQGLAKSNINTRITALYIHLEFDPKPDMPTDITLKITHDGKSTFNNGTAYLEFSTPSLTEDITSTVLPQVPEKDYVLAKMSANAFDCSENNPDWMIEKACPGLYANYLITVPHENGLNCPEFKMGTNCQDLDLSSLLAIHFYGKVMYL